MRRIEELLGEIANLTKEAYSRESTINDKENRINLLTTDIARLNITIEQKTTRETELNEEITRLQEQLLRIERDSRDAYDIVNAKYIKI